MEKEYAVIVKRGISLQEVDAELTASTGAGPIPNRTVDIANPRLGSTRMTHWMLTDLEANELRNDARILAVEIPPDQRDDIKIGTRASQEGAFERTAVGQNTVNWGLRRCVDVNNNFNSITGSVSGNYNYALDGSGVDIVIQDSGLQVDHPEFMIAGAIDSEYNNGAIIDLTGDGSNFFSREVTVNGVRIVAAGAVGGQTAVPDAFVEKVARMFELFTDVNGAGINEASQRTFIKTLSGDAGTYHAAVGPTLQRVARGAGSDYTPNFLTDSGIASYNLSPLFDSHVANDMVWYLNSTGDAPGDGDNDAQEVIEHVFHTLHMHGLDAVSLKMYSYISADWASGPLYAAMEEAYDAGKWDSSGYGGNAWKTDGDAFEVAAKEYLFLLNFGMFEYSSLWDGGSLSPEWTDDMRTQSGIQANNPLGYALHNTYIAPVISKPSLTTIRSIFQDGDTGNPTLAGASGYVVDNYTPIFSNNIGAVQYNSDINQFAGRRNSGVKSVLGGLYSDDYQTFVRPNSDNTINFTTQGVNVATMSYQATTLNRLELGGIDIDGNTIQTNTTNSDLILAPESGQGKVQFENLHFLDNTITNTSNGAALFNVTGDGYIKLNQPTAFVIPAGSTVQRPSNPQVGELRRNSDLDYLEVYTVGGIWSDASGSGETVSEDEMNNIMNEYILIFG
jgi:hypothetical protein